MSEYQSAPEAAVWPGWSAGTWPPPHPAERLTNWRNEVVVAGFAIAVSVVLGGVLGLIWPRVAPKIDLVQAIAGSEAAAKAVLGDDMWFALLGIVTGIISVGFLMLVNRDACDGPGGLIGVVAGGLLGSLIAVHVGHQVQQPHQISFLHTTYPKIPARSVTEIIGYFGFTLRIKEFIFAWPIAAILMHSAVVIVRYLRDGSRG